METTPLRPLVGRACLITVCCLSYVCLSSVLTSDAAAAFEVVDGPEIVPLTKEQAFAEGLNHPESFW